jgi:hypothetical protein
MHCLWAAATVNTYVTVGTNRDVTIATAKIGVRGFKCTEYDYHTFWNHIWKSCVYWFSICCRYYIVAGSYFILVIFHEAVVPAVLLVTVPLFSVPSLVSKVAVPATLSCDAATPLIVLPEKLKAVPFKVQVPAA